jgi:hypothetical protein
MLSPFNLNPIPNASTLFWSRRVSLSMNHNERLFVILREPFE